MKISSRIKMFKMLSVLSSRYISIENTETIVCPVLQHTTNSLFAIFDRYLNW